MKIEGIDHIVLTVRDAGATLAFYTKVLGLEEVLFDKGRKRALAFGNQKINIFEEGEQPEPKTTRPIPGSAEICFVTEEPLERVIKHIESCGVEIYEGPVEKIGALGPLLSVYIKDPDENLIEIASYKEASAY